MTLLATPPHRRPAAVLHASSGWERFIAAIGATMVIITTTQTFQFVFADAGGDAAGHESARGNPIYLALFATQFGLFLLLFVHTLLRRGIGRDIVIGTLLCLFVTTSAYWSVSMTTTLIHATAFCYLVIAAYVLSVHFPPAAFIRIYYRVTAVILVLSFVLLIVAPELASKARFDGAGIGGVEFHGVMASKNLAGFVFISAFVIALNGASVGIGIVSRLVVGCLALAAAALSNSATTLLIMMTLTGLTAVNGLTKQHRHLVTFTALLVFLIVASVLPFASVGVSFDLLGRDSTFTGRTALWRLALENMTDRPLLGFGYSGFFDQGAFSPVWQFWDNFKFFRADTFHNSAMDVAVSLGIAGLVVLFIVCLTAASVVFQTRVSSGARTTLALLVAVFILGGAMEFTVFHHLYVATLIVLYSAFTALRRESRQAPGIDPHLPIGRYGRIREQRPILV